MLSFAISRGKIKVLQRDFTGLHSHSNLALCCFTLNLSGGVYDSLKHLLYTYYTPGLPLWLRRLRIRLQCRRPGFDPWVGKIPLEKGKATHSSILTWRIPWTVESMGLQRVGHDSDFHSLTHSPLQAKHYSKHLI